MSTNKSNKKQTQGQGPKKASHAARKTAKLFPPVMQFMAPINQTTQQQNTSAQNQLAFGAAQNQLAGGAVQNQLGSGVQNQLVSGVQNQPGSGVQNQTFGGGPSTDPQAQITTQISQIANQLTG